MADPREEEIKKALQEEQNKKRPTGVTIICVLGFLISIFSLIGGIMLLGIGTLIGGASFSANLGNTTISANTGGLGILFSLFAIIPLISGIIGFIAFYLLMKMKKTGFFIVIILGLISIVMGIISSVMNNIISIVIWGVIIGYLLMKRKIFS
ncbi:MAG TPA: hypothetical protein VJB11_00300 [archaeon]|nr:hypothetical protein [archaeon]